MPLWGWILIWWFAIVIINIFGTLGYAEEEFWSSCLKLGAIGKAPLDPMSLQSETDRTPFRTVVFMIIAFVLVLGGGPELNAVGTPVNRRAGHEECRRGGVVRRCPVAAGSRTPR